MKNRDQSAVPATVWVESTHRSFCGDKELPRKKVKIECHGTTKVEAMAMQIFAGAVNKLEHLHRPVGLEGVARDAIKAANTFFDVLDK